MGNCIVVGVPDGVAGHVPCGVIVKRMGSNVSAKEIRTFYNSEYTDNQRI